jgi:hypothetical protein
LPAAPVGLTSISLRRRILGLIPCGTARSRSTCQQLGAVAIGGSDLSHPRARLNAY